MTMMDGLTALGPLPYLTILLAAAIESEVVFLTAAVLVGAGRLEAWPVFLVGAAGASLGDQVYFYLFRLHLTRWLDRLPLIARRQPRLAAAIRQHGGLVAFALRFAPGLRIALAASCAYGGLPALRFSALNFLGGLVWAGTLLGLVAWAGPSMAARLQVSHTWMMAGVALVLLGGTLGLAAILKRTGA